MNHDFDHDLISECTRTVLLYNFLESHNCLLEYIISFSKIQLNVQMKFSGHVFSFGMLLSSSS